MSNASGKAQHPPELMPRLSSKKTVHENRKTNFDNILSGQNILRRMIPASPLRPTAWCCQDVAISAHLKIGIYRRATCVSS